MGYLQLSENTVHILKQYGPMQHVIVCATSYMRYEQNFYVCILYCNVGSFFALQQSIVSEEH